MQADTEFGTVEFLKTVRKRSWRAVVGMRRNRKLSDGHTLKQLELLQKAVKKISIWGDLARNCKEQR